MRMQEQGNPIEENSDDYIFPMGAHDSKLIDLEKIDLASHPSGMDSARSKNTVSSKGGPVSPSPPLSPTSYWSSPNAHKGFRDAKTAPPLDLRKVDFGEPMETPLSAANVPSTADYAAGSALHFARKNNRSM